MLLPELQTSFHLSLVKPSPGRSTICFLGAWTPTSDGFWRKASWQHVSHTEMLLFLFSLSMLSPLRISHVSPQAPALRGWPPLFLFHKPNGNPLTEVPQLFSQSTNTPVPRSIASSFPPVITEEAFGSLITLLYTVLWLLYPLLSQGPYIIIIILSLLYPPSLPLNWVFLIGIYMSPIFNFTNALLHFTKPPLAYFTNRRWLCFLSVSCPNHFLHSNLALSPPLTEFSGQSLLTFKEHLMLFTIFIPPVCFCDAGVCSFSSRFFGSFLVSPLPVNLELLHPQSLESVVLLAFL